MYEGPLRTNVKSVKTSILVLKVIQGHCFGAADGEDLMILACTVFA